LHSIIIETEIANAEGIEDGGDAGGCALGVMSDERGPRGPAGIVARLHLAFEVVRVQIDDPRDEVIPVEIETARACGFDSGYAAVADHDCARRDRVGEDEVRVGKNDFLGHWIPMGRGRNLG
jgi:hypothetical protein